MKMLTATLPTVFLLPWLVVAQEAAPSTVPIQATEDGTEPKPEDYRSPPLPPEPGQQIRKIAEDSPGKPQENFGVVPIHDNQKFFQVLGKRLEYQKDGELEKQVWEIDAWYGGDHNKLYLESEGEREAGGKTEAARLEVFWNHAVRPFWDMQLGVRHDFNPRESRSFFAGGFQGIAPYGFETDLTAYISEDGDVSWRLEIERGFHFTQRLELEPRLETDFSFSDVPEYNIGEGFTGIEVGLRLRYMITPKFAPYLGISWQRKIAETADRIEADGGKTEFTFALAGIRFWF
ncbi:Copper resistance protein B precursor [Microbulbifer aggregans]|uniref:Copper resistance protein B n=1 Tax=Microbulbifer aggregans TaxID=1769779 RepID=A0A1C9WAD9_9GAMM|nr:copper resistance protein B [Microbulbifer aggregans]AOS98127.1 Copper resistance protein B precursor [Microbulbifer aggregans]